MMSIMGRCPYCDGFLWVSLPDDVDLPVFAMHDCDECGQTMWTKLSRVDPESWTIDAFRNAHVIDEETKTILSIDEKDD